MSFTPSYEDDFISELETAIAFANEAKSKSRDPSETVEVPVAEDMAERCEKLLEREYGDKVHGLAQKIRSLESSDEYTNREEMSLKLAEEYATGELSEDFETDANRVEASIRTSIALLTEGVVAAPIEGLGEVKIESNDDGTKFIRIPYFGPIRSAGGTAQAVSVLVADYIREKLNINGFQPRDDEIERYVEEIELYDNEVGMQYCPPKDKTRYIIEHLPIMVDGQPNSNAVGREVDGYRDLERIEGNHPRDGMCLVVAEGIGLKAPKLQKYAEAFDLQSWDWLNKLIEGSNEEDEDDVNAEKSDDEIEDDDSMQNLDSDKQESMKYSIPTSLSDIDTIDGNEKFLGDVIAGRPIFCGPNEPGGFRLRYGRARNTGHAAVGYSPSTMILCDKYISSGTQMKTERPGKAAGAAPVDSIQGPFVELNTGENIYIEDESMAREIQDELETLIDLGEVAVPYGEFVENNHPLVPGTYSVDWWREEMSKYEIDLSVFDIETISAEEALELAKDTGGPLHPEYTFLWHDLSIEEYAALAYGLQKVDKISFNYTEYDYYEPTSNSIPKFVSLPTKIKHILEKLLVPHVETDDDLIIEESIYNILNHCTRSPVYDEIDVLQQVNDAAPFEIRPKSLTRIGTRMGRPEKAERREMKPAINSLFPIGESDGDMRRLNKAAKNSEGSYDTSAYNADSNQQSSVGSVSVDITHRICPDCKTKTWKMKCENCETRTKQKAVCPSCGQSQDSKSVGDYCQGGNCNGIQYGETTYTEINIKEELQKAYDEVTATRTQAGDIKSIKRLKSKAKIAEPLEKGILRSKYDISVFRDGTARFDMCDLPLTAFKPSEIGLPVEKCKELGYDQTINQNPITDPDDLIELKMQDIVINHDAAEYMIRVTKFIDDLLVSYYNCDPYYNVNSKDDLIGELVIGMAPHTSAGVTGRIIGYTDAGVNFAHPFYHANKRRNCDGDEDSIMMLLDCLLNFSRDYLPDQRGKNMMDAPIVLTGILDPTEIDDEAHNVDIVDSYPFELYEKSLQQADPDDVSITIAEDTLENPRGFSSTLSTTQFDAGPEQTEYKVLGNMEEKTTHQLELAKRSRGIDESLVASLVVEKHFFPDLIGNLTAFSRQEMMCRDCGRKHRRTPANGSCLTEDCDGEVNLTVYEGMVDKYLDSTKDLVEEYGLQQYTKQRLELMDERIESIFSDDTVTDTKLTDFIN